MLSSEETEVLGVVLAENRAFWMKDAATFASFHLKEDVSLRWGYIRGGGFFLRKGWNEIGPRSLEHMERLPRPVPEFADAPLSNVTVRVSRDLAWVSYDKDHPTVPELRGHGPNGGLTHNLRVLERHHGIWLIAVSGLLDAALGDQCVVRVSRDGRILWKSRSAVERLRVDEHFIEVAGCLRLRMRRLNGRFHETIDWAASRDTHFMPSRGTVPFHLESDSGMPRIVWIVADMASAILFLEDRRPFDERIEIASRAFSLSAAQQQLALALCEGIDPSRYAKTHSVSPNTVRTHLKRVFEKTGVSSQVSLTRLLMSFSPPY